MDHDQGMVLADLFRNGIRSWDSNITVDHDIVKSIPLGNGNGSIKWIWHFDAKRFYKVRSRYRIVWESKKLSSSSSLNPDVQWWRKLWKLQILLKSNPWGGGKFLDFGLAGFSEWRALNRVVPKQLQIIGSNMWMPPPIGLLKMNVDVAVLPASHHIGMGVVIHNDQGMFCGALAKALEGSLSSLLAECLALREGLKFAHELEVDALMVESDAINLVSAINDNTTTKVGLHDEKYTIVFVKPSS
ncbi:hypothetical protein TIFTF001_029243 [Ficus carica]|uniref:RNase H type-1 domain-containing protein n=1 Tax=Ficus carica TaxID=3494 RepID=A0AA88DRU5_FICCA|nr:hypothetical protein TIFTF001_029243 [Ficus carica]